MESIAFIEDILLSTYKSLPALALAGLASMITMKIGLLNLGLEGSILIAAFTAMAVNYYSGSAMLGLIAAVVICALIGYIFALFNLKLHVNNIIISVAINVIGQSLTKYLLSVMFGTSGAFTSDRLTRLPTVPLPFLENIPILNTLSNQSIVFWACILATAALMYIMNKTPLGLRIRATGLNSTAVNTAGVNSDHIKYGCCIASGALCGLAGAYLSTSYLLMFMPGMSSGRGFLGNIASILGGRTTLGTFLGSALFSVTDSLTLKIQTFGFPSQLIQLIPYTVALVCLILMAVIKLVKEKRAERSSLPTHV